MNREQIVLHLMSAGKFTGPFSDLLEKNFDDFPRHVFLILGDDPQFPTKKRSNIVFISNSGPLGQYFSITKYAKKAEKVILHGLFGKHLPLLLLPMPWVLHKCYWVIWGGDLYFHKLRKKTFRSDVLEALRTVVIKRIGHLVTYIEGDADLARKWYGNSGKYHECLMYPSNTYREYRIPPKVGKTINILIGNSADPTNRHFEIFEMLERYRDDDIQIFAPLSYGDKAYALRVAEEGKRLFGDKFTPFLEFMPFDEYLSFLGQIDIAMFNHRRQQAMGNIITLLGLGKKVFIRSDITPWKMFEEKGVKVYDINNIDLMPLGDDLKKLNHGIVSEHFSESILCNQLENIFKE